MGRLLWRFHASWQASVLAATNLFQFLEGVGAVEGVEIAQEVEVDVVTIGAAGTRLVETRHSSCETHCVELLRGCRHVCKHNAKNGCTT